MPNCRSIPITPIISRSSPAVPFLQQERAQPDCIRLDSIAGLRILRNKALPFRGMQHSNDRPGTARPLREGVRLIGREICLLGVQNLRRGKTIDKMLRQSKIARLTALGATATTSPASKLLYGVETQNRSCTHSRAGPGLRFDLSHAG